VPEQVQYTHTHSLTRQLPEKERKKEETKTVATTRHLFSQLVFGNLISTAAALPHTQQQQQQQQ